MKKQTSQLWTLGALVASASLGLSTPAFASNSVELAPVQELKVLGRDKALAVLPSGLALYTFDPDKGAPQPACNGACAERWPPVLVEESEIKDNPELGTIKRASGLSQLTIGGKPVYTFFLDRKTGDLKGDGLGGVWHLIELY